MALAKPRHSCFVEQAASGTNFNFVDALTNCYFCKRSFDHILTTDVACKEFRSNQRSGRQRMSNCRRQHSISHRYALKQKWGVDVLSRHLLHQASDAPHSGPRLGEDGSSPVRLGASSLSLHRSKKMHSRPLARVENSGAKPRSLSKPRNLAWFCCLIAGGK